MLQGYIWKNPTYFSQIPEAGLSNVQFPRDSTLIQYVEDLYLYSIIVLDSQKNASYLL